MRVCGERSSSSGVVGLLGAAIEREGEEKREPILISFNVHHFIYLHTMNMCVEGRRYATTKHSMHMLGERLPMKERILLTKHSLPPFPHVAANMELNSKDVNNAVPTPLTTFFPHTHFRVYCTTRTASSLLPTNGSGGIGLQRCPHTKGIPHHSQE